MILTKNEMEVCRVIPPSMYEGQAEKLTGLSEQEAQLKKNWTSAVYT